METLNLPAQIAKHFRAVYFGGNWTSVHFKEVLSDADWQQAITMVQSFNTIAALVYHTTYYVSAVLNVLRGGPLQASDKYSFDLPLIASHTGWQNLLTKTWNDAEDFAAAVEQRPESKLSETFADEKYGTYYANLRGIVEHNHYHLGQIVMIKKAGMHTTQTGADKKTA